MATCAGILLFKFLLVMNKFILRKRHDIKWNNDLHLNSSVLRLIRKIKQNKFVQLLGKLSFLEKESGITFGRSFIYPIDEKCCSWC